MVSLGTADSTTKILSQQEVTRHKAKQKLHKGTDCVKIFKLSLVSLLIFILFQTYDFLLWVVLAHNMNF